MKSTNRSTAAKRFVLGFALAGAFAGSAGIAAAQSDSPTTTAPAASASADSTDRAARVAETPLTGDVAEKVRAAALAAVPGATIDRVETDSDGSPYEAHITKSDGTKATVKVDANFNVTSVDADQVRGVGGHGRGGHGGGAGETPLTGDVAEKVKAAALAAVPGATIDRVETDSDGSPYEAHITKSDGTKATVKVDANFNVTSVED